MNSFASDYDYDQESLKFKLDNTIDRSLSFDINEDIWIIILN